jgi:leucyl aminopeptidase (aminopeptidase T)
MKANRLMVLCSLLALFAFLSFSFVDETDKALVGKGELAKKLVNQCGNIQENDIVLISGGVNNIELLENISTEVRKIGAYPLLTINSDRMTRKYFDEVPPKYDSKFPLLSLKLASIIDAMIQIASNENQSLLDDVEPERFIAISEAGKDISNIWFKKGIKSVSLGNNLYPTSDRAKLFNMSVEELEKVFWAGVNTDYQALQKIGNSVKQILLSGKEISLAHSNGTDFKVGIENKPVNISDGVITDDDIKAGGTANEVWLPAGEVYLTPIPETASGKIVVEKHFYQGKEINDLVLVFSAGKLQSMKAKQGIEPLEKIYNAGGEGKENFSFIDIGINPNVKIKEGSNMVSWMSSGMITVGIGDNTWAGGENESNYSSAFFLKGYTLKVDDKILVENGELNL